MELNISYDPDLEEANILVDNVKSIRVHRNSKGEITFSKNIDDLTDDDIYDFVKQLGLMLMKLNQ